MNIKKPHVSYKSGLVSVLVAAEVDTENTIIDTVK